jgi:DNA-binding NtrC family response regulator
MKSTILLIDDDPIDIKAIQRLIENWDYEVIATRSGQDALAKLETCPVDVIISDIRMPSMSGEDVVRAVGRSHAGLPVVLVTGHGDIRSAVQAMKIGAFDYVVKPPDEDEFRIVMARAVEHSRLRKENACLRADLGAGGMYVEQFIGRSPAVLAVIDLIDRVAMTDSTVLITGETGTGKELAARTIHYRSRRTGRPLVAVNCASLNPNLIESELFGHEKGAFTGAIASRRGRFEEADGGTL